MIGTKESAIQSFLLAGVKAMADPRYVVPNQRAVELFDKLMSVLTREEHQQWLMDFEGEATAADTVAMEYVYLQGLEDGIELLTKTGT